MTSFSRRLHYQHQHQHHQLASRRYIQGSVVLNYTLAKTTSNSKKKTFGFRYTHHRFGGSSLRDTNKPFSFFQKMLFSHCINNETTNRASSICCFLSQLLSFYFIYQAFRNDGIKIVWTRLLNRLPKPVFQVCAPRTNKFIPRRFSYLFISFLRSKLQLVRNTENGQKLFLSPRGENQMKICWKMLAQIRRQ